MEFSDILALVSLYATYVTSVFAVSYGVFALYEFFRALSSPSLKID